MRFLGGFFRVFFLLRTGISTRPPTFFPNGYPKMMDGRMKIYMFNFRWLNWKLNLFSWCFGSLGSQRITWQKHRETLYPSNSKPPWAKISVHFFFGKATGFFCTNTRMRPHNPWTKKPRKYSTLLGIMDAITILFLIEV